MLEIHLVILMIWFVSAIFSAVAFLFPGLIAGLVLAGFVCLAGWVVASYPLWCVAVAAAYIYSRYSEAP